MQKEKLMTLFDIEKTSKDTRQHNNSNASYYTYHG